ncbi:F-box protein CPR30 [Hibiscus syriacus]|uniref:F-box protein CPR30 n=1 Tax=Hibiscus syriacus TaxID=106335 RepID=A0A6A3CTI3_HIBSY|nr:F-box protein CPR30 [Hibiscus syriacus]
MLLIGELGSLKGFNYQQSFSLVNVKFKWVKVKALDAVIDGERDLRAACNLVSILSSFSKWLSPHLPSFPTSRASTCVPCFELTLEALNLHYEELDIIRENAMDLINRLRKLLMLSKDRTLPLQTIDQLKWDLGLPYDYCDSLIPNYTYMFSLFRLPGDRIGLKLLSWDDTLAVSQLEKNVSLQTEDDLKNSCLAFPMRFTRGFWTKEKVHGNG